MVINKNNLKHTLKNARPLLSFSSPNFFFFLPPSPPPFLRNCSEIRPPERLRPRLLRAPSAIGAIPRSVACPRSMLLSSAAPLGSPSRRSLFSTVSPPSATNDLFVSYVLLSLPPPPPFFFNKVTVYIILNFSRIFVILLLQFYYQSIDHDFK